MKTFIILLAVATCCLTAEVKYAPAGSKAQSGLLVLPRQSNSTSTTPRSVADGTENLEDVNVKLSQRLKQEQGSQQGEYHVYLQDGRLQRVQYTTAPVAPVQQTQQQQTASNNYNQQQTPEILSPEYAERRGVYFVQVPQERIQALQANAQQASQQSTQNFQPSGPAQYKQESSPVNVRYLPLGGTPDEATSSQYRQALQERIQANAQQVTQQSTQNFQESIPVNVRYLPFEDTFAQTQSAAPSSKYRQEEAVVRYLSVPLGRESEQYGQQYSQQEEQQAVVQYSEVQPISGPVYSYSPESITRILRYAPVY